MTDQTALMPIEHIAQSILILRVHAFTDPEDDQAADEPARIKEATHRLR